MEPTGISYFRLYLWKKYLSLSVLQRKPVTERIKCQIDSLIEIHHVLSREFGPLNVSPIPSNIKYK